MARLYDLMIWTRGVFAIPAPHLSPGRTLVSLNLSAVGAAQARTYRSWWASAATADDRELAATRSSKSNLYALTLW